MNLEETVALLTWMNQYDPRVQLNAAARDIWHFSLMSIDIEDARQAVMDHSKVNDSIVVNPSTIYKRAKAIETSRAASQRARMIEGPASTAITNPRALRSRNPELWDQLFEEGRRKGNEDRARNHAELTGVHAQYADAAGDIAQFSMPNHDWADEPAA